MLRISRKGHHRVGYFRDTRPGPGVKLKRIGASYVDKTTFLAKDRGKRGRTPKSNQWFPHTEEELGWKKSQPIFLRRRMLLVAARKFGSKNAWHKIHGLANVTADPQTKKLARADAAWLAQRFKKK